MSTVIVAPTVRLISAPHFFPVPKYELPDDGAAAERVIAQAGKVCYDSYGRDGRPVQEHIDALVSSGHHSVLEHAHIGIFIEGISRGCSHEIVRHRMFNYSQRSTRYTAEGDAACVLDPFYADIYLRESAADRGLLTSVDNYEMALLRGFLQQFDSALLAYSEQVRLLSQMAPAGLSSRDKRKWCNGKARQLLPHALETRMVMTGNIRAWIHFLTMRSSRHAEAEIRRLADEIFACIMSIAPSVFDRFPVEMVDGYVELTGMRG